MEQRKRIPTGTFERQLVTGEHTVIGKRPVPPTPPALQPLHAALGVLGQRVGEQVEHQQDVVTALRQLAARLDEIEHIVARSTTYYHEQANVLLEAVRQTNQLHEAGNSVCSATYSRMGEVTSHLEAATRSYRENTMVRQQTARSWLVRAVYAFNQHRTAAVVGVFSFSACLAAFGVVEFLTR